MCPANDFNPDTDAKALRKAMKGLGKGNIEGAGVASGTAGVTDLKLGSLSLYLPEEAPGSLCARRKGREGVWEELGTSPSQ